MVLGVVGLENGPLLGDFLVEICLSFEYGLYRDLDTINIQIIFEY